MATDDPTPLRDAPTTIVTADGCTLETVWSGGTGGARGVVVLTHPHPAYGGDMHNVVPAGLARSLPGHGFATLRFNFRGTGASTGTHDGGPAERADVSAALATAATALPGIPVLAVGYSFGADVLLSVDVRDLAAVVAIAPPLAVLPLDDLAQARRGTPTMILSPEHDQFRPTSAAVEATEGWPDTEVRGIAGADHFLTGAGGRITDAVVAFFDRVLILDDGPGPTPPVGPLSPRAG